MHFRLSPICVITLASGLRAAAGDVSGDAVIRGPAGGSEIVLTTTSRLAGAVDSLTWGGREFIDSADHGRQLQSAASFDCGRPSPFWAECYNPTEAGSRRDGAGPTSTSELLSLRAEGDELATRTRMAYWLNPGEQSSGRDALNQTPLSSFIIKKHIRIGYHGLANVIDDQVTFTVPEGETHRYAQYEALTGYMPPEFNQFFVLDPSGTLTPIDAGPGEQPLPLIFSTPDGSYAMGIYSPGTSPREFDGPGYGRFAFAAERVVKWNCVFRERAPNGIPPGDREFRLFVAVGTKAEVRAALAKLRREFDRPTGP